MGKRKGEDPRQLLFAEAFIATKGNGTKSAGIAGYNGGAKSLAVTASRLLRSAKVQQLIAARMVKAVERVHGAATPEEIISVLTDHLRAGKVPYYKVDPDTGEPIIDLRELEKAGLLHLVKKVSRRRMVRTYTYENGSHVEEETRNHGVEVYSAHDAAELLGRFYGMDKSRPETPLPIVDSRTLIVAILESGDKSARAFVEDLARKLLPGPGAIDVEAKRG